MKCRKFLYIAILFLSCCIVCSLSADLTYPTTVIWSKNWSDYTDREKKSLRERWRDSQVEEVVTALKDKNPLPGLFATQYSDEGVLLFTYDLRGISLRKVDLQYVDLSDLCLQGADLSGSNLSGANLWSADLQGANLTGANLHYATLHKANLQGASLAFCDLQNAGLWRANLKQANLANAKLKHARLWNADLQDADLFETIFDSTYLSQVDVGQAKNIRYLIWGDSIENRYVIGEEVKIDFLQALIDSLEEQSDSLEGELTKHFRLAENTHRDLKTWYKRELLNDVASEFHYRENEARTKGSPWLLRQLRRVLLKWTYGYGSRPIRLLPYSLAVVCLFSVFFAFLTIPRKWKSGIHLVQPQRRGTRQRLLAFRQGRLFLDCFYFSALSFATFGYGALQPRQWLQFFRLEPVEYKPVRWARIAVGFEALLGIYIFFLLVKWLFGKG